MRLDLRISDSMSEKTSPLGSIENRLIRIPEKLRGELGLKIGLSLNLKAKDGSFIPLQVAKAYLDDAEEGNYVCVSSETYHLLQTELKQTVIPVNDILIGCDPEFFIVDRNTRKNISAGNLFPYLGEIGNDCGLAELRPAPADNPSALLLNIHNLLQVAQNEINERKLLKNKELYMVASSFWNRAAAGFHIHFGLPPQILIEDDLITEALRHRMVTILDYYVGVLAIIPEGDEDCMRRSHESGQYGKPGDFRYSYLTFEYRVPGGHLLRHPLLTLGLFAISKLVMTDMLGRIKLASSEFKDINLLKNYSSMRSLYPKLPDRSVVYNAITSTSIKDALGFVDSIEEDLKKMIGFSEHKEIIDNYLNYIRTYATKGYSFSEDIAQNWRLTNERQPVSMAVHKSSS